MKKYYVVRDKNDARKLALLFQNFPPRAEHYAAPFDLNGRPEDPEWLQIESIEQPDGSFKKMATVDQDKKQQILLDRAQAKDDKRNERNEKIRRRNKINKSIRDFKDSDLQDSVKIRQTLKALVEFVKENYDLSDQGEE